MSRSFDPSRLAGALGFTPEELMLNRAGSMSDRQRAVLRRARRTGWVGLAAVGVVAVGFAVVAEVFVARSSSGTPVTGIVLAVVVLVLLIVALSTVRTVRRLGRLSSAEVREITGPARVRARRMPGNMSDPAQPQYGGGMRYEVTIGKTLFFVPSRAVIDAFDGGGTFRAYYASGGGRLYRVLLSAERVG